jgi:hypothetical protein
VAFVPFHQFSEAHTRSFQAHSLSMTVIVTVRTPPRAQAPYAACPPKLQARRKLTLYDLAKWKNELLEAQGPFVTLLVSSVSVPRPPPKLLRELPETNPNPFLARDFPQQAPLQHFLHSSLVPEEGAPLLGQLIAESFPRFNPHKSLARLRSLVAREPAPFAHATSPLTAGERQYYLDQIRALHNGRRAFDPEVPVARVFNLAIKLFTIFITDRTVTTRAEERYIQLTQSAMACFTLAYKVRPRPSGETAPVRAMR